MRRLLLHYERGRAGLPNIGIERAELQNRLKGRGFGPGICISAITLGVS